MTRRIPILMFHQVTPHPDAAFRKYAITPQVLALQMDWIAHNRFTPITLDEAFVAPARTLPAKPIVITFDDGYQDCFEHAVPVLLSRRFTATFFIVSGLIGKRSAWLLRERGVEYSLMDRNSVRSLADHGFECGAHTMTHPRLAELSGEECREELRESRTRLEDVVGHPVRHLSYPFGSFNPEVRAVAAECGYLSACTVLPGIALHGDDPLTLRRVPVNGTDLPLAFTSHIYPARANARRLANRLWRSTGSRLGHLLHG